MCGIVGAISTRDVTGILLEGLKRLEYRGYDSAGMAVIAAGNSHFERVRRKGKVQELADAVTAEKLAGVLGVAHTRWATHGAPSEPNAHPHVSSQRIALVHNGIIENHEQLRQELVSAGYQFTSETDTEVVAHLIHQYCEHGASLRDAVQQAVKRLEGAFALGVIDTQQPDRLIAARSGSPLVVGVGIGENFIASDQLALLQVTDRFIFLEEGDFVELTCDGIQIFDGRGKDIKRATHRFEHHVDAADKGAYRHYMLKEIFEQPEVVAATLTGRMTKTQVLEQTLGATAKAILDKVQAVQIIACGTSYHAGLVARYWIEDLVGVPCNVEVASEYRYRKTVVSPDTLFITISQSGETADTLAALRMAKDKGYLATLGICNVGTSTLVRESDLVMLTQAGPEIGVASTKAFTTQLVALLLVTLMLARRHGLSTEREQQIVTALHQLPALLEEALTLDPKIKVISEQFADKHHALFLGRGAMYPVAMEGALKLKEISYIHAEAYPAGELKHGPLALVDSDMPVITVAPNNELLDKLKSNLQEVKARGGVLYVFADRDAAVNEADETRVLIVPPVDDILEPILYTVPLQLLSYHVAVLKGTDVDQPRNLAKSVTVE
ncbi:MAG: glutamine--fructose-6-phosphate transaminase (isomerizing) [Pseudomonadales bacterium]|nr:glutamine--fructose-6-phosphate transaminase (isomerizing) [Pseudomonadales bacterium]